MDNVKGGRMAMNEKANLQIKQIMRCMGILRSWAREKKFVVAWVCRGAGQLGNGGTPAKTGQNQLILYRPVPRRGWTMQNQLNCPGHVCEVLKTLLYYMVPGGYYMT